MDTNLIILALFILIGILLPLLALTVGRLLRPHIPTPTKMITYESGSDPTGESWVQFHIRYYLFALLFVIFDVEVVFLYPWAATYDLLRQKIGLFVLVEMMIFVFFLILGLFYAWKKKVLEWK